MNLCHSCSGTKFADDSTFMPTYSSQSTVTSTTATAGDASLVANFVDSKSLITAASVSLVSSTSSCSRCKNSEIESGETCEDIDYSNGDGCSSSCILEIDHAWNCDSSTPFTCTYCGDGLTLNAEECDPGGTGTITGCASCVVSNLYQCSGSPSTCTYTCGTGGYQPTKGEACDDNNNAINDGCTNCVIDAGYTCTGTAGSASSCAQTCGDGDVDLGEACDDHNTANNDGCNSNCAVENMFDCSTLYPNGTSNCISTCGNSIFQSGKSEGCDDGNTSPGDGCSSTCTIETADYGCNNTAGAKSICFKLCSDGTYNSSRGEDCDDQNEVNNDGCSSICKIETGYFCDHNAPGTKDTCYKICGDGKINYNTTGEDCDDGNPNNNDGCSSSCKVETGYECTNSSLGHPSYNTSICIKKCGNGVYSQPDGEECDDQNYNDNDGCNSTCKIETGYICDHGPGQPPAGKDTCYKSCGDAKYNYQVTNE